MTGLPSLLDAGCDRSVSLARTYRFGICKSIPFRESPTISVSDNITHMDATTHRTQWMRHLVVAAGGPAEWVLKYGGTRWAPAQVSQWTSEKRPKSIGGPLARALEKAQGLSRGTLDSPLEPASQSGSQQTRLDGTKLAAAISFVRQLESSYQQDFLPDSVSLVVAAAYEYLLLTQNPNTVEMSVTFGKLLEVEDERLRKAAGAR